MGIGLGQIRIAIPALRIVSYELMFHGSGWNNGGGWRSSRKVVEGEGISGGRSQTFLGSDRNWAIPPPC